MNLMYVLDIGHINKNLRLVFHFYHCHLVFSVTMNCEL